MARHVAFEPISTHTTSRKTANPPKVVRTGHIAFEPRSRLRNAGSQTAVPDLPPTGR